MKRKILILAPILALALSGCFARIPTTPTSGGGKSSGTTTTTGTSGTGSSTGTSTSETPIDPRFGTLDNPITIAQAKALIDEVAPTPDQPYTGQAMFVKAKCKSNSAVNPDYGNAQFVNLIDGTDEFVLYQCILPSGYTDQDCLAGKIVTASGYGNIHDGKYQLTKKDNDHRPEVLKVEDAPIPPLDYGTLDDPLTIAEAKAVIDQDDPTSKTMYVTGTITKNTAWSTQFNNLDIDISDGTNTFKVFRTATFPEGYDITTVTADALVGKTLVASGTGTNYQGTYELKQGCKVEKFEEPPVVDPETIDITAAAEVYIGAQIPLTAKVNPEGAPQDVTWSIESGSDFGKLVDGTKLEGLAEGEVVVKATSTVKDSVYKTATIQVKPIPVKPIETLTADPTSLTLAVGETAKTITLTASPTDFTEELVWDISAASDIATINVAADKLSATVTPVKSGTAKISMLGGTSNKGIEEYTITVTPQVYTVAEAYAAAQAAGDSGTADVVEFTGVVTGTFGNNFLVQDGQYGIYCRPQSIASDVVPGKLVKVTARVGTYKSQIQTANGSFTSVVLEDGTLPNPVTVTSKAELEQTNQNILVNLEATLVSKPSGDPWSTSRYVTPTFKIGNDTDADALTFTLEKTGFTDVYGPLYNEAVVGETFVFTNLGRILTNNTTTKLEFFQTSTLAKKVAPVDDPEEVEITSANKVIKGQSLTLSATVSPSTADQTVTWSIVNGASLATLVGNELTAGNTEGKVTVRATSVKDTVYNEQEITITKNLATSIVFEGAPYTLDNKAEHDMNAKLAISPSGAEVELDFELVDPTNMGDDYTGDASIDATTGVLTIPASVTDPIGVKVTDLNSEIVATAIVNVNDKVVHVDSVTVSPKPVALEEGATQQLTVSVLGPGGATPDDTAVIWSSDDADVATVSETGLVTAVAEGTATITVKSHENASKLDTCAVTVTAVANKYGTETNPITVAQAIAAIDEDGGQSLQPIYLTGVVTTNKAWSSYGNVDITISDAGTTNSFLVWRAANFPEGFNKTGITVDSLVGKTLVAGGVVAKYYSTDSIYETNAGPTVFSVEDTAAIDLAFKKSSYTVGLNSETDMAAEVNLLPKGSIGTVTFDVTGNSGVSIDSSTGKLSVTATASTTDKATVTASLTGTSKTATCEITVTSSAPTYVFQKVTTTAGLTDGKYLIVCESQNVLFDGSLTSLDVSSNTQAATISAGTIAYTAALENCTFTYNSTDQTLQSASGYYIGSKTTDDNGMLTNKSIKYVNTLSIDADGNAVIVGSANPHLAYNKTSGQTRFRYFKTASYGGMEKIQLYKLVTQ